MGESEDDELAYAYYAANTPFEAAPPYDRKLYGGAYLARAYACYRRHHVDRVVAMVWKACGLKARTPWQRLAEYVVWGFVRLRLFLARPSMRGRVPSDKLASDHVKAQRRPFRASPLRTG